MRREAGLEPAGPQCQVRNSTSSENFENQDSQYETQASLKKRGGKKARQEQTSKLQIKGCEMQRRIADPYQAWGRGGRGDQCVCVGVCASSL